LIYELTDFEEAKVERSFLEKLTDYLDSKDFSDYDLILIEGQMAYMGKGVGSVVNSKIQQHLESYFLIKYRNIQVEIVSASSKYPKELKGETPSKRKRWAVERMKEIYRERGDLKSLRVLESARTLDKSDDLADASLLILAFGKKNPDFFSIILEIP
jgi:hypothetical protein